MSYNIKHYIIEHEFKRFTFCSIQHNRHSVFVFLFVWFLDPDWVNLDGFAVLGSAPVSNSSTGKTDLNIYYQLYMQGVHLI